MSAYEKAKGIPPTKDMESEAFYHAYGKTIGQFHRLTKLYQVPKHVKKSFEWHEDSLFDHVERYMPESDAPIISKFNILMEDIKKLPKDKDNYELIHTDVHTGNFFVDDLTFYVFDFDDSSYMWFISDIAIVLYYRIWLSKESNDRTKEIADFLMTHFMRGYLEENTLTKKDLEMMPTFLKLREYLLYFVVHRSLDVSSNDFAKMYVERYRERILNDVPFIDLDFSKYI